MNKILTLLLVNILLALQLSADVKNNWIATEGPYGANIQSIKYYENSDIIYIATKYDGIYQSTDRGENWKSFNNGDLNDESFVNDILIDDGFLLLAVTDSLGILKKSNNYWKQINSGFGGHLRFKSILKLDSDTYLAGSLGKAIYKTTNAGESWSIYNDGLSYDENVNSFARIENEIFIATDNGVFQSTDDGHKWTAVASPMRYVNSLMKYSDSVLIAASTKGTFISSNKGNSWNYIEIPDSSYYNTISQFVDENYIYFGTEMKGLYKFDLANNTVEKIEFDKKINRVQSILKIGDELFIGTNYGMFKVLDKNYSAEFKNRGLGVVTVYDFVNVGTSIYAATDNGVYKTTNEGMSWDILNSGFSDVINIKNIIKTEDNRLLAATHGDGLYFSTNEGEEWSRDENPDLSSINISCFALDSSGIIYVGTFGKGVYKSSDEGMTWNQMYGEDINQKIITSIEVTADNYILAGTENEGIFIKFPSLEEWQNTNDELVGVTRIYDIDYIHDNQSIVLSTNIGIFISHTLGQSWYKTQGNLIGPAETVYYSKMDNILYAGIKDRHGLYQSTDWGELWEPISHNVGFNSKRVKSFNLSERGFLYCGVYNGKCYRTGESFIEIPGDDAIVTLIGENSFCDGGFCVLDAGEWANIKWSTGNESRYDTVWIQGEYWFSAKDSFGLDVYSDTITVEVFPKPNKPRLLFNGETLFCTEDAANYRWFLDGEILENINQKSFDPEAEGFYKCEIFSEHGCNNISEEYHVEFPQNISEIDSDIKIYPNPVRDYLILETGFDNEIDIQIFDAKGNFVFEAQYSDKNKINANYMNSGTYYISVQYNNSRKYLKFIKVK